jgi:hypothetical protein
MYEVAYTIFKWSSNSIQKQLHQSRKYETYKNKKPGQIARVFYFTKS